MEDVESKEDNEVVKSDNLKLGRFLQYLKSNPLILTLVASISAIIILVIVFFIIDGPRLPLVTDKLPQAFLNVESPKDQEATTSAQITVEGKTTPISQVVAYSDVYEQIFESDINGNFSGVMELEEGPNEITFIAFGNENEETVEIRSVVFVSEEEL